MRLIVITAAVFLLGACGGSGGNSEADSETQSQAPAVHGKFVFQAINGQSLLATAELYSLNDLDHAICRDTAADERIEFLVSCIDAAQNYWLRARNTGFDKSLCRVISGEALLRGEFRVNAATDALCQSLENFIRHNAALDTLDAHAERVIQHLVATDLDGDGDAIFSIDDLSRWQPGDYGLLHIDNYVSNKQHFSQQRSVPSSAIDLNSRLIGHIDTRFPAHRVIYDADFAYVANDFSVSIVDVSVPSAPEIVASWPTGWIKDIAVLNNYLYIALGERGIEKVDISRKHQPMLAHYFAEYPAYKISTDGTRNFFHAIADGELLVGAINADNRVQTVSIDDDYGRQMATLLKVLDGRLYSVTTAITTTYITIFDKSMLNMTGKYSLTQDFNQPELAVLTELFIHNRVDNTQDLVIVDDTQVLYLIVDPLKTINGARPKVIVEVSLEDYSLQAESQVNFFSLIEKHNVQVGRADGIMKIHHDFDFDNKDSIVVPMPEHVKMFYFDDTAAAELRDNPLTAINSINSAPFQKRFQITANERYSFFASDRYGFNIISNF